VIDRLACSMSFPQPIVKIHAQSRGAEQKNEND
jgi:hypothetical protein